MRMNTSSKFPTNAATNITHNVNLSFEIGTTHVTPTENNEIAIEDVMDANNSSEHNDTNESDREDINDGTLSRARIDEGNGKPQGISHGPNHEMRSGCPGSCTSHLGNPHGISPDNDCVAGTQEHVFLDTTLGVEAIGQHVKTNGKPQGISHATRMPIIADPTLVPQIYSGVKRKGDSTHMNRCNLSRIRPENAIVASIRENISVNTWEEEAIGQHVKTKGKPQGISQSTRMPIVDSTLVEQIHSNVKRQLEEWRWDHVDTDKKLLLLMQEVYPHSYSDYASTNPFETLAISILKTSIVPKISYTQRIQYPAAIKRINKYRLKNEVPVIPEYLLGIDKPPILMPAYNAVFSSDNTTTHGQKVTEFLEHMRLMKVEIVVMTMITDGIIPDMSEEERGQLKTDLEEINEYRAEASQPALDISKSLYEHFPEEDESSGEEYYKQFKLLREERRLNGDQSDESSVDPPYESDSSIEDIEEDPDLMSSEERTFRNSLARRHEPRRNGESNESSVDPPSLGDLEEDRDGISPEERNYLSLLARRARNEARITDATIPDDIDEDDELFGDSSDPPRRTSNAVTSNDATMEDLNTESRLIDLTNVDQNNNDEMVESDTSASMKIAQVSILNESVVKFIKQLYAITKCPLTMDVVREPLMGTDKTCYEKEAVRRWLQEKAESPTTRVPMEMHCLTPDYTMSRIVEAFEAANLTEEVIDDLYRSLSESPIPMAIEAPTTVTVNPQGTSEEEAINRKNEKKKRKKARVKANLVGKIAPIKSLKIHKSYLKDMNMYEDSNMKSEMPPKPSYSLMHSLKDGFSILMYSGSHRTKLCKAMCMHKYNAVRIILPEWMAIIWHESLFHAGAKSREGLQDMRLFSYIWPEVFGNARNRTKGSTDGVAREYGDQVYRDDITNKICKDFYEEDPDCGNCSKEAEILDLRGVLPHSFAPGDRIIGCLKELGWVVIRGIRVQEKTYEAINTIADSGYNGNATNKPYWTSIEDRNSKRVMKYKHNSTPHVMWSTDKRCSDLLGEIKTELLDKHLEGANYIIGKFNLLKNNGDVPTDQQAHTDYQPRQAK